MKKALVLLLVAVMLLGVVACNKTNTDTPATATPPVGDDTPAVSTTPDANATPVIETEKPEQTGAQYGGTVRIVCTAEGAGPIGVPWEVFGVDVALLKASMEPIATTNAQGELELRLVEGYEIDMENLEIIWTLKQGIYFHDGSELNAETVVWNYENFKEWNLQNASIDTYEVVSEYVLKAKLNYFANAAVTEVSTKSLISKEAYEKNGVEWARDNPIGTGPFVIDEYVPGSHARFKKNENYWKAGEPYLDGMEFVFIRDVMTQNIALQSTGDQSIDLLNTTSGEQISTLRELGFKADALPIGPISLAPNSLDEDSPLAKLEVRQAISYALDRQSIMDARGFGVMTPATQWVVEAFPAGRLDDSYNLTYNLEKAKELMIQAGYPDGFKTTLIAQPALADKDAVVAIQSMLAKIGIECAVEFPDSGGYSNYRSTGWDGLLVQHTRAFSAMETSFWFYFSDEYNLLTRMWFGPERMQELIDESRRTMENAPLLQEMHKIVMDNMLLIPVYNLMDGWVYKPNLVDGNHLYWGATMFMPSEMWISND